MLKAAFFLEAVRYNVTFVGRERRRVLEKVCEFTHIHMKRESKQAEA